MNHIGQEEHVKGSFNCVWMPSIEGHISHHLGKDKSGEHEVRFKEAVCEKLRNMYNCDEGLPCGNCGWFAYWSASVNKSYHKKQELYFAYLEQPLYENQPQFLCTWDNKYYYVGKAQKVELEWAQDMMLMEVKPIKPTEIPMRLRKIKQLKEEIDVEQRRYAEKRDEEIVQLRCQCELLEQQRQMAEARARQRSDDFHKEAGEHKKTTDALNHLNYGS